MKIERISDNQVKFILSQKDLEVRNIKISELAYGAEKTQALFKEMMEQASTECGFEIDNVPLMIEAIPFSTEGITIIVTKVGEISAFEEKLSLIEEFKKIEQTNSKSTQTKRRHERKPKQKKENISIFSFKSLDDVTLASVRLYGVFNGTNILFKESNRYFLFLENDYPMDTLAMDDIEALLSEYGQKHISNSMAKNYLSEHGEIIIRHPAIKIMAEHLGD